MYRFCADHTIEFGLGLRLVAAGTQSALAGQLAEPMLSPFAGGRQARPIPIRVR